MLTTTATRRFDTMRRKTSNSPYPILYPAGEAYLAEQGYSQAHFDTLGDPSLSINEAHNLVIKFSFDLTDSTLLNLIDSGAAEYYVNIECGHTYYRRAFVQTEKDFLFEIPYGDISDSIEIFIGLVAAKRIDGFSAPGFSSRFGAATFDIDKGDILAVGTGWTVELEGVDGSANPYIYVNKDSSDEHSDLWVNGSQDTLIVSLSKELYDVYFRKKKSCKAELIALVMKPAILSALLTEIARARANGDDARVDVTSRRWLRKIDGLISRVLNEEGATWDINAVKVDSDRDKGTLNYAVDALLRRPLAKAMEEIRKK